jgi:hypothetical protein
VGRAAVWLTAMAGAVSKLKQGGDGLKGGGCSVGRSAQSTMGGNESERMPDVLALRQREERLDCNG